MGLDTPAAKDLQVLFHLRCTANLNERSQPQFLRTDSETQIDNSTPLMALDITRKGAIQGYRCLDQVSAWCHSSEGSAAVVRAEIWD